MVVIIIVIIISIIIIMGRLVPADEALPSHWATTMYMSLMLFYTLKYLSLEARRHHKS